MAEIFENHKGTKKKIDHQVQSSKRNYQELSLSIKGAVSLVNTC